MDTVRFPNLYLEPPAPYQRFSNAISETALRNSLDEGPSEELLKTKFGLFRQGIDNCHTCCYDYFDVSDSDPVLQDYFGFAQLLKRNFWPGYYYCHRASYCGRDRDQLDTALDRLDDYRHNSVKDPQEKPLFPLRDADKPSIDTIIEQYNRLCEVEDADYNENEIDMTLAETNLVFASSLLSYSYDTIIGESPSGVESPWRRYCPLMYLLTLQPERAKDSADELGEIGAAEGVDKYFLPTRVAAHAASLRGNYREAAKRMSEIPRKSMLQNPSLVEECYLFYRFSGDVSAANDYIREFGETNGVSQQSLNKKERIGQTVARLREIPPILVSTISKSGSTFLFNQIQDRLSLPKVKIFTTEGYEKLRIRPHSLNQFAKGGAVCRQHFPPSDDVFEELAARGIDRVVFHVRDPRRALISWVFYQEATLRKHSSVGIEYIPDTEPRDYARRNFQEKVEHQIDAFLRPTVRLIERWIRAQREEPSGVSIKITRFEDMVSDPDAFLLNCSHSMESRRTVL